MKSTKKYNFKYDFEVGYFVESPCKKCIRKKNLPRCADCCDLLGRIHAILSDVISCTRRKE